MSDVTPVEQQKKARESKKNMAIYKDAEDLINVGAYNKGSNQEIETAVDKYPEILKYLQQETNDKSSLLETYKKMNEI